jgi:type IV pilus assembly protein PilB
MKAIPIGQLLVDERIITSEQLNLALEEQKKSRKRIGEVIADMGFASERDILRTLAQRLSVEYVDSPLFVVELDSVRLISESLARQYNILPIYLRAGTLTIATNDPLDFACLEDVAMITGFDIRTVLSPQSEIERAINRVYSKKSSEDIIGNIKDEFSATYVPLVERESEADIGMNERIDSAPIVKLVNSLVLEAYQQNASDIHIEPNESSTRIRFRIDGDLQHHNELSHDVHQLISTRIKIISGMNIAEKRVPQDGSFQFKNDFLNVDIRVSSLPTPFGEKLVLRLLGADRNIDYNLHSLGLSDQTIETIEKAVRLPHGIILVTGPTGSGKTTTLYSMLNRLKDPRRAIVTIEDPIEKKSDGITQVQVNARAGLSFASGLRSILRQDPDTIMVGEIRDGETAEIAIRAAITGHLVLSTLHTNDALSTVVRLVDMGVEPFLVASSVKCVIAQRLVKKLCPHCKEEQVIQSSDKLLLKTNLDKAFAAHGCSKCNNTGYTGRTAVFEIVLIDGKLERMISEKASMDDLKAYAEAKDLRTLRDEVMDLVESGKTSIEEAVRILYTAE